MTSHAATRSIPPLLRSAGMCALDAREPVPRMPQRNRWPDLLGSASAPARVAAGAAASAAPTTMEVFKKPRRDGFWLSSLLLHMFLLAVANCCPPMILPSG